MSKIEDVKKAFEVLIRDAKEVNASLKLPCSERFIGMFEIYGNQLETLQSAINALTEPEKIDLSDLRVGDEVEHYRHGWGELTMVADDDIQYPYQFKFHDRMIECWVMKDGKEYPADLRPSIISVRRKPRRVKKTVEGTVVVGPIGTFWSDLRLNDAKIKYPHGKYFIPINETEAE